MTWQSTNLADAIGGIAADANAAISEVQSGLTKLNAQVGRMTSNLNRAVGLVAASMDTLDKLMESGFFMITLSPRKGAWNTRLAAAPNAPANLNFSCGTAVVALAPDAATVAQSYQRIADAVKKPMADATNIVNPFDFSDFSPLDAPAELAGVNEEALAARDWAELFKPDEWKETSLGEVFGGYAEGIATATNQSCKSARSLLASVNQSRRSASAINRGLSATRNLITQMEGTGVYRIVLPPGEGAYLHRLQTEPNAPPTSAQAFTAGYACVAVAQDLAGLASKYATLSKIVSQV